MNAEYAKDFVGIKQNSEENIWICGRLIDKRRE
jgi:hypothetical protein